MDEQTSEVMENEDLLSADTEQEDTSALESDDLFSDLLGESEPAEQENEGEMPTDGEQTSEPDEKVVAKYNGQEIPLSKQAVTEIAQALGMSEEQYIATMQKGMNYDHVVTERDGLKNAKEIAVLDEYAKQNGMTRAEFVDYLEQNRQELALQKEQEALQSKYPDTSPELLAEVAQNNLKFKQIEQQEKAKNEQQQQQQEKLKPWQEFFAEYPDIKASEVPIDVTNMVIKEGITPVQAMQKLELQRLRSENEALKTNKKNKEKAIGSTKTSASEKGGGDFWDYFLNG